MPHPYKYALLLVTLLLPYMLVVFRNRFDKATITTLRFVLAVAAVWIWMLCIRVIVDHVDARLAVTHEQLESIYAGDGARNAFALLFGWVPGIVLATLSWGAARLWRWCRPNLGGRRS